MGSKTSQFPQQSPVGSTLYDLLTERFDQKQDMSNAGHALCAFINVVVQFQLALHV